MPNKDSGSVVHIDGRGSWKNNASLLEFKASPDATFAAADLKAQYMQTADDRTRFDDTLIAPSRFAWGGLPFYKLSDWRTGRPTKRYPLESWPERDWKNKFFAADEVTMKNGNWMRPAFPMEYAFRTAGLVREEHPFAMIIDDIRQDGVPHDFAWRFFANATLGSHRLNPLPKAQGVADLILFDVGPKLVGNKPDGSKFGAYDYTLREQPDHGEKVLLLRFLETPSGKIDQVSFHPAKHPWIDISSRSVEGGYKTILLPMRYGVDPLPETRWSDPHDRLTIAFAGRKPRTVYFEKGADQRTRVAVDTPIEGDVQVRAVSHRVAETDQRPLQFEFIRAGNVERDCLIEYAMDGDVDGDDLELPLSGAITIAKGKRSAILSVGVKQDRKKEDLEEVRIRIVKAEGSVLPQHHTLARARAVILDEPRDFNSLLGGKGKKGQ